MNAKWIEEPENYLPKPTTIRNVIRWNIAISKKIAEAFHESDQNTHRSGLVKMKDVPAIHSCPDACELLTRQKEYMCGLDCLTVAKIEASMMLGRDLWIEKKQNPGKYTAMIREMGFQGLKDLNRWIEHYGRYGSPGWTVSGAVDYINSKNKPYLQTYLDAVESVSYRSRNIRTHCRNFR